jgi:hypothetical protein
VNTQTLYENVCDLYLNSSSLTPSGPSYFLNLQHINIQSLIVLPHLSGKYFVHLGLSVLFCRHYQKLTAVENKSATAFIQNLTAGYTSLRD